MCLNAATTREEDHIHHTATEQGRNLAEVHWTGMVAGHIQDQDPYPGWGLGHTDSPGGNRGQLDNPEDHSRVPGCNLRRADRGVEHRGA